MHTPNPLFHFSRQLFDKLRFRKDLFRDSVPKRIAAWYLKIILTEPFRLTELLFRDKQIRNHRLEKDPIFILGHWRSGTSILHSLLAQDRSRGFLHKYASVFPESFLSTEQLGKPLARAVIDSFQTKENISKIAVSWEWDAPGELDIAMTTLFSPYSPHWGHMFPDTHFEEYMDKYVFFEKATAKEEEGWKQCCRYLLNKVSIHNDNRQLIIKSPGNTARVKQLLQLYPDAKFIYIHRNPFNVFYSNVKLWKVILNNLSFQQISEEKIHRYILHTYKKMLDSYRKDRLLIPERNLYQLRYENLVDAPFEKLREIYSSLSLDGFEAASDSFRSFIHREMINRVNDSPYSYDPSLVERIGNKWHRSLEEWPYENPLQKETAP